MKPLFVLGCAAAAADATGHLSAFEGFRERHNRILNNPYNQKLFAEKQVSETAAEVETPNLRSLARLTGNEAILTLKGYANSDCTGPMTMFRGLALNECHRGVDQNGHEISSRIRAYENPLKLKEVVYLEDRSCNGPREKENLMAELPFDPSTYNIGDCSNGLKGELHASADTVFGGVTGIAHTVARDGKKCADNDFFKFDVRLDGVCMEMGEASAMYSVGDCATSGKFTKQEYSDKHCSVPAATLTADENFETCRNNYHIFDKLSEEDYVFYEHISLKCLTPSP